MIMTLSTNAKVDNFLRDTQGTILYKNYLPIEFSEGVKFDDPESLLEGKGELRRHLKIQNVDDIENKKTGFFVKRALACNG